MLAVERLHAIGLRNSKVCGRLRYQIPICQIGGHGDQTLALLCSGSDVKSDQIIDYSRSGPDTRNYVSRLADFDLSIRA